MKQNKYILWAWCSIGGEKAYPTYYVGTDNSGNAITSISLDDAKPFDSQVDARVIIKTQKVKIAWVVDNLFQNYLLIIGRAGEEKSGLILNRKLEKVEVFDKVFDEAGEFLLSVNRAIKKYQITFSTNKHDLVIAETIPQAIEDIKLHEQFRTMNFTNEELERLDRLEKYLKK